MTISWPGYYNNCITHDQATAMRTQTDLRWLAVEMQAVQVMSIAGKKN